MKLVIVESPNKRATIKKYLGEGFEVLATAGHFRDLPKRDLGVDLTTFTPTYEVNDDKANLLSAIRKAAKEATAIYLASDADREGEAIAWHLVDELGLKNAQRIRFTEITPKALTAAVAGAGSLDQGLVDAQQARRVVDRLVGYQLSPLLSPFGKNHSAGRVQSAALHLVLLRELEREAHVITPYWTLATTYSNGLVAKYAPELPSEIDDARIHSEDDAQNIAARARAAGQHRVESVETKPVERKPKAPFTTSSLQQAASVVLKFKPDTTMELAQSLFEAGHISYHRSDSVTVSDDAAAMARAYLQQFFPEALPTSTPVYKSKASAQGAHECIRPTSLDADAPEGILGDELRLYQLIRARFLASQCKPAVFSQTKVVLSAGDTRWVATGTTVLFESHLRFTKFDEEAKGESGEAKLLPVVSEGQALDVSDIAVKRQETKPPPRYTEATLIRAMEGSGIGRPSTFASTLKVLFTREYIAEEKGFVAPCPRGRLIDGVLTVAFPALVEAEYTAHLEDKLDQVAEGRINWRSELASWYGPWSKQLAAAAQQFALEVSNRPELAALVPDAPKRTGKPCPLCTKELMLRHGKKGAFLACSGYPGCAYTADPNAKVSERPCPKCSGSMNEREGKFGPYAKCQNPACGGIVDLKPPPEKTGKPCPLCTKELMLRQGQKGPFLACSGYPECSYTADPNPKLSKHACPKCSGTMSDLKSKFGPFAKCQTPNCGGIVDLKPESRGKTKMAGKKRSARASSSDA